MEPTEPGKVASTDLVHSLWRRRDPPMREIFPSKSQGVHCLSFREGIRSGRPTAAYTLLPPLPHSRSLFASSSRPAQRSRTAETLMAIPGGGNPGAAPLLAPIHCAARSRRRALMGGEEETQCVSPPRHDRRPASSSRRACVSVYPAGGGSLGKRNGPARLRHGRSSCRCSPDGLLYF